MLVVPASAANHLVESVPKPQHKLPTLKTLAVLGVSGGHVAGVDYGVEEHAAQGGGGRWRRRRLLLSILLLRMPVEWIEFDATFSAADLEGRNTRKN